MISNSSNFGYDKYHRKKSIKGFGLNYTMYSLVTSESKDGLVLKVTGFMENNMSYNDLIISAVIVITFQIWSCHVLDRLKIQVQRC